MQENYLWPTKDFQGIFTCQQSDQHNIYFHTSENYFEKFKKRKYLNIFSTTILIQIVKFHAKKTLFLTLTFLPFFVYPHMFFEVSDDFSIVS